MWWALLMVLVLADEASAAERMIGLVEVPALHANVNAGGPDTPKGPVALFAKPSQDAEVAVVVRDRRHLESREHGYEEVSAVVYALESNSGGGFWYRLRYSDGEKDLVGWLSQADAGEFRSYYDIVSEGMTYLTEDWDGRIFELPDPNSSFQSPEGRGNRPDVQVAGARRYGEDLWLLVVLVDGNICNGGGKTIIATGWIPAYAANGSVTIWHFSRGC